MVEFENRGTDKKEAVIPKFGILAQKHIPIYHKLDSEPSDTNPGCLL